MKTLKQVSEMVGMSRRVIQEYEKAGVAATPETTNKYGYLLYDDQAVERLWQIRFYRELGYSKKEIKAIFDNPKFDKQKALKTQIELLIKKKEQLELLIDTAKKMNEIGISPSAMRFGIPFMKDIPYDYFYPVLREMFNILPQEDDEPDIEEFFTESDVDVLINSAEEIILLSNQELEFSSNEVQNKIKKIHGIFSKVFSDSIIAFSYLIPILAPGGDITDEIDEMFGQGKSAYLYNALQYYCQNPADSDTDREWGEAIDNILLLARKKYTADSEAVQAEVARMHQIFCKIKIIPESERLNMLKKTGELYDSNACKQIVDNGAEHGKSWFLSKAIQIYCKRLE